MKNTVSIADERDIALVAAKSPELYAETPLAFLTAYSLFWLHEWRLRRTIEAVAILNWRLFPEKFSMVGFQEYPDAFRTNRSLLQMQPKYRNLVTGAASKGFSLNERGMEKARELISVLGVPTTGAGAPLADPSNPAARMKKSVLARSIEPEREVERVHKSKLFEKWTQGVIGERDLIHVHALLRIFDHTPVAVRERAMKDLEAAAAKVDDAEVLRFLEDIHKTFPQVLSR